MSWLKIFTKNKELMMKKVIVIFLIFFGTALFAKDAILIGIAGGTGSGKTTLSNKILNECLDDAVVISQDSYYNSLIHLTIEERTDHNFDHPDSIDIELFATQLNQLKNNMAIEQPIYDFCTHSRLKETVYIEPKKIIIVEGILLLAIPELRDLFDIKIYVDTSDDLRLLRRIERDIKERGRTFQSVKDQYLKTVYPMHNQFVDPSKRYADFIVPCNTNNGVAIEFIVSSLKDYISKNF